MTPDKLFLFVSAIILIGWLPLLIAPGWKGTRWLMYTSAIPLLLASFYVVLNLLNFFRTPGGFFSLQQVSQLFQNRALLLAAWVHFGSLDLFVGYWEAEDAQRCGLHRLLLLPCLLLTFFFGPAGLLAYFVVRGASGCKPASNTPA
jgi:hypothetical protein